MFFKFWDMLKASEMIIIDLYIILLRPMEYSVYG